MDPVDFADPVILAFVVIPLALVTALTAAVWYAWRRDGATPAAARRAALLIAAGAAAWMAVTAGVAGTGAFRQWTLPPPIALLVAGIVGIALRLAFSPVGRRIATHVPLYLLIGVQAFRLPLELAMHALADRGVMPEQMSYSGRNFDIVTGVTAVIVAALAAAGRAPRAVVGAWNVLGLALLANIVVVSILSTPLFAYFGQDRLNVFVTYPPFVWLPAVMVLAALAGHLVIFRALRRSANPGDIIPRL